MTGLSANIRVNAGIPFALVEPGIGHPDDILPREAGMEGAEQQVTVFHLASHEAHEVGELILDRIRCLGAKQHLSQPEINRLRKAGVDLHRPGDRHHPE